MYAHTIALWMFASYNVCCLERKSWHRHESEQPSIENAIVGPGKHKYPGWEIFVSYLFLCVWSIDNFWFIFFLNARTFKFYIQMILLIYNNYILNIKNLISNYLKNLLHWITYMYLYSLCFKYFKHILNIFYNYLQTLFELTIISWTWLVDKQRDDFIKIAWFINCFCNLFFFLLCGGKMKVFKIKYLKLASKVCRKLCWNW